MLDFPDVLPLVANLREGREVEESAARLDALLRPRLRRYFAAHGAPAADVDDLVQRTFWRVFQGMKGLHEPESFPAWLFVIARNVRFSAGPLGERDRELSTDLADPQPSAEARLIDAERLTKVRAAIAALPPQQRHCLLLRLRSGASYAEIAATMRLSVFTVRNHLAEARRSLERRLSPSHHEEREA